MSDGSECPSVRFRSAPLVRGKLMTQASAILLATAWLAPNHDAPWAFFYVEILALVAALLVFISSFTANSSRTTQLPMASVCLLVVALVPPLQWRAGLVPYYGDALLASGYVSVIALALWGGGSVTITSGRLPLLRSLSYAMLWSGVLSTGIALYQWFGLAGLGIWARDGLPAARAVGNLAQHNQLATLLMFGLASTAWLHFKGELGSFCTVFSAGFLLLGTALTSSRQPLIGGVLIAAWYTGSASMRRQGVRQLRMAVGLLFWGAACTYAVHALPISLKLVDQPVGLGRLQPGLRPLMWSQFVSALQLSPWLGYGWQGGAAAQAAGALHKPGFESTAYAHDIFLDLLTWNGLPLGGLLAALLVFWYVRIGIFVRRQGGWFQFAVLTFFLGHALVEYPHAYLHFLVPVALLAGQLDRTRKAATVTLPRSAVTALVLTLTLGSTIATADYLALAQDQQNLMFWKAGIHGEERLPDPPNVWMLDQLGASAKWARIYPAPGMPLDQIREQGVVAQRFPTEFFIRQSILISALNHQFDGALIELQRLRGLFGEAAYRATVSELQALSASSEPGLAALMVAIKSQEPYLPLLPNYSRAMSGSV